MIPSGHNCIQATRSPASPLIIFSVAENHTHPSSDALSDLQQRLILPKVLIQRVKDISDCHLLPLKDVYI